MDSTFCSPRIDALAAEQPSRLPAQVQDDKKLKATEQTPELPLLGNRDHSFPRDIKNQQSSIAKGICSAAIRKSQQEAAAAAIAAGWCSYIHASCHLACSKQRFAMQAEKP